MRPLSLLSWNDKKRTRVSLSGMVVAAAAAASATVSVGAAPAPDFAGTPAVRVIVTVAPGSQSFADRDITEAGGQVLEHIQLINASVASVPAGAVGWLAEQPGIEDVTPDGQVQLSSSSYSPTTDPGSMYSVEHSLGVDQAWQEGYTGAGVGVALIDTGVSPVEGLAGNGQVINGPDLSFDNGSASIRYLDAYGHGTFMAGIIAGRDPGAVSGHYAGDSTDFLGIAPDAHIVNVKVGGANGAVDVSQVLAAIDWVVANRNTDGLNIRVLNLSFGTNSIQSYIFDPLAYAAEAAWQQGIVVVAAAGNRGNSGPSGLNDPAIDPYVIAVGASQPSANGGVMVAPFSSRGNAHRSPDVIAPGKSLVSLADPGSVVADHFSSTGAVGTRFFRGSGTSQATAVVSGVAALLLQEHPDATPDQIKALLTSTSTSVQGGDWNLEGHGEVSASAAAQAPLGYAVQRFAAAHGTGSLELSRGTLHVSIDGVPLVGEQDIFGNGVSTSGLAALEANGDAWSGGTWNGAVWSGSSYVPTPTGADWVYSPWTEDSWAGIPWSAVTIPTGSWTGTSWSGTSWSGTSWSGTSWSGTSWSGTSWSGTSWSGTSWSGTSWSTSVWSSYSWS